MEPIEQTFLRELNALCAKTGRHLAGNMRLESGAAEYELAEAIDIPMGRHVVRDRSGNHVVIKGEG